MYNKENKEPGLNYNGKEIQSHEVTTSHSQENHQLIAEQETIFNDLKEHIDKTQNEIEIVKQEKPWKDHCIRTGLLEKQADREAIRKDMQPGLDLTPTQFVQNRCQNPTQNISKHQLIAEQETIFNDLKEHIDKIQNEIAIVKQEKPGKDQCIRIGLLEKQADREAIRKDMQPGLDLTPTQFVQNRCQNPTQNISKHQLIAEQETIFNDLKEHIDKIQSEIEIVKQKKSWKDQCIRIGLLEKQADREAIRKDMKTLEKLEYNTLKHTEELLVRREEYQIKVCNVSNGQKKLRALYQQFEGEKGPIDEDKKNEARLLQKYDNVQNQLAELNVKHETLKSQCDEIVKGIPKVGHEHDAYKKEKSKLQSILKRLEIKISSLETALKQKSEECLAISSLYEDISGR